MKNLPNKDIKTLNLILPSYIMMEMELIRMQTKQFIGIIDVLNRKIKKYNSTLLRYMKIEKMKKIQTKQFIGIKNPSNKDIKVLNFILLSYIKMEMELIKIQTKQFIGTKDLPNRNIEKHNLISLSYMKMIKI